MPEQNHEGRIVLVNKISEQLAQLTASVNIDVKNNLSTRNVLAENMLAGLLNRMEGWKLINANRIRSNYPAVDLVDKENRIAVQVTSTNGAEKIKHTLEEFEKNDLGKDYDRLYVVIITTDSPTPSMRSKSIPGIFSGETDIWNTPTLLGKLMDLPIHALEDIHSYLTEELGKVDGSRPYLYLPPDSALGDGFVGRETELDDIRQQVDQGVKPVILSGLGGIGKTVLASRFGRLYPDGEVYFIRFQTSFTATVTGLYGKITPAPIQPPSEKEQLEAVMKLLGRCTERDLLIFDNVDADSGDLSDLMKDKVYKKLRQMRPRILLTTRFDRDRALPVRRLPDANLKEIFRTHGADLTDPQMDDLIEAVNGHTMTVDLMARTLNGKGWRKVTAEDMLRAIRENTLPSEKYRKIATDYNQSEEQAQIYQHLSVVFDLTGVPENGQNVLRCATLLPEGGMEGETFGISLPENQQESLDELLDHGWLSIENDLLRIHPIIRLVCREELKPTEESCGYFLDSLWEQYDVKNYSTGRYNQLAETFAAAAVGELTEKKADWINHAGEIWNELMQSRNAKELYDQYLPFLEEHFPGSEPLATAYNWLGLSNRALGDYKSAFRYLDKALAIRKSILTENDPDLAKSYNNIGDAYGNLGDHNKALEYKQRALVIFTRILPSKHPDLATSYDNVGFVYGQFGDHRKALEYQLKALEIRENVLSPKHPDLATSYNNVGCTYGELGDHRKALEYKRKALEIRKILPPEHPDLANSYNNVGYTYGQLGDHRKALEYKLKALEIRKIKFHPEHPDLASSYNNVGCTYGEMGNHRQAQTYHLKALEIRKIALSPDHPDLASSYNNVGATYGKLGDHRKALEYLRKALEIYKNALPPEHPDLANSYGHMGCTYGELGRYEEALVYLKKALVILEKHLPKNDSRIQATKDFIQLCQQKLQVQQNMAKAGFNFDNPFASLIPPKK